MIVCEDDSAADIVGCHDSHLTCDYNPGAEYATTCTYSDEPINGFMKN